MNFKELPMFETRFVESKAECIGIILWSLIIGIFGLAIIIGMCSIVIIGLIDFFKFILNSG